MKLAESGESDNGVPVLRKLRAGYALANLMVAVLRNCGDDFSRDNIMRQARSLKGTPIPMLIPGIVANTSASDHAPIEQMQMKRFVDGHWERFGPVRSGIDPGAVSDSFKAIFRYASAKRDLASQLNANTVSLMTGSYGSTYSHLGDLRFGHIGLLS